MSKFTFHDYTLKAHTIEGQIWFESADIAKALGYADKRSVSGIYANYKSEFAEGMTKVVDSTTSGNLKARKRVFSLRGVHLLAMFARTSVAEDFRKWVLDLIEREESRQKQLPVDNRRGPYRNRKTDLPAGVYHNQSKYNPYRATTTYNGKYVHIGCYPTVDAAVEAIENYYRTGAVQRLPASKNPPKIEVKTSVESGLTLARTLDTISSVDLAHKMSAIILAAQYISCSPEGKELAWEMLDFIQQDLGKITKATMSQ
ncbi:hypothetical protein E4X18_12125 [Salmonella enterica]|nr:hypothetical protein [Salmonella enterica]